MIFDKYGSYNAAFILSGSTLIIGIILMSVVQRMISGRLDVEQTEKAVEVVMDSPDDLKVIVDFDDIKGTSSTHVDKQHLVPWRRRLREEPYSRPTSLIISRLLDDTQSIDGTFHRPSHFEDFVEQGPYGGFPVVTLIQEQNNHPEECNQDFDTDKDTQSIASGNRESLLLLNRNASGSINSDSGRSTGSEETASVTSGRSRLGSTDTAFEYDTQCLRSSSRQDIPFTKDTTSEKGSSTENIKRYSKKAGHVTYSSSCSQDSEKENGSIDDIFSKLMESALEIETTYYDATPKCGIDFDLSGKTRGESPFTWYQGPDSYRETVL
jgi:hypothetical protein